MVVGAVLFFGGMIAFMAVTFGSGGWRKSRQFRVIGEVMGGKHGRTRRRVAIGALVALAVSVVTLFAGVSMKDRARADRCRAHCRAAGYDGGTIGPSKARQPDDEKAAAFVACTCTAAGKPSLELRADALGVPK
jgi:hypothetical protein